MSRKKLTRTGELAAVEVKNGEREPEAEAPAAPAPAPEHLLSDILSLSKLWRKLSPGLKAALLGLLAPLLLSAWGTVKAIVAAPSDISELRQEVRAMREDVHALAQALKV